jgi:hypothetical protein
MPVEALLEAKFSHKSDVFAFGVLLWEVLSFAKTPWGAFGVQDMVEALQAGDRLQPPGVVDEPLEAKLYALALRCWHNTPAKRPPFLQLREDLSIFHHVLRVQGKTPTVRLEQTAGSAVTTTRFGSEGAAIGATAPAPGASRPSQHVDNEGYSYIADPVPTPPTGPSSPTSAAVGSDGYVADSATSPAGGSDYIMPEVPSALEAQGFASPNRDTAGSSAHDYVMPTIPLAAPSEVATTADVAEPHDYHLARNEFAHDYHLARNESGS